MHHLSKGKLPTVAIIGAGVSGLRCADLLTRAGAKVTIFEARNRIGGRVHQVNNGGYLVDVGSNWIHGTEGNPIMELAGRTKTEILYPNRSQTVFDTNGKRKSEEESEVLAGDFWAWILKGLKYSEDNTAAIDKGQSLLDWLRSEWSEKYKGHKPYINDLTEESRMWGQFVGSPIERQSLKFFWLEDGMDGENVFVASTYQKILNEIAAPALDRADIRLNTEIKAVEYRASGNEQKAATLTTATGSTFEFDEIVVTCPLGWLKEHASTFFSPSLPTRLSQAIANIGYGALEKLYITFPSAFWLDHGDPETYSCFTNFHNPTGYHPILLASKIETTSWNQSIVSLAHLPGKSVQPTLLFYMTGDGGAYITSRLKDVPEHSKEYNDILQAFAEPFYSRLPNYNSAEPNCKPTSFYQTTWQTDQYAGYGSYSTFRTGLEHGDEDIEVMRATGGLGDAGQGLWLAGEHTAPFVALGTTTGAFWSGERVARRIAKLYGFSIDPDELELVGADVKGLSEGSQEEDLSEKPDAASVNPGKNMNGGVEVRS